MTRGRIPIKTDYAKTDLVHLKVAPYGGYPSSQATPAGDFFKRGNELQGLPYNIKHYGATGEGVTYDIPAKPEPLHAASSAGGGTVYVPQGHYGVSSAVILPINVNLKGAGAGRTIGVASIDALNVFAGGVVKLVGDDIPTARYGQIIEGLYVRAGAEGDYGRADYGIEVENAIYGNIIRNVKVAMAADAGIYFHPDGCWVNTIEHVVVTLCQRGIDLRVITW